MREGRRRSSVLVVGCVIATLCALAVYGFAVEPRSITVTRVPVVGGALATALDGRTAVLLSDLHFSGGGPPSIERVLESVNAIRPDIVFLVGDYVRWKGRGPAYEEALDFLSRLSAPLGVFAVLGDADTTFSRKSCEFCHEPGSGARTRRHRVTFLRDEVATVAAPGGEVAIAGLAVNEGEPSTVPLRGLLSAGGTPAILLSHISTVYRDLGRGSEVMVLSGDTHGGQVRLPGWFWRLVRRKPDPEHVYGLYREGSKVLFVTRGIGTSWPHLRLGEPPEVAVLEFHARGAGG
jgi:predicted MPP superfamily phosphohydrolase